MDPSKSRRAGASAPASAALVLVCAAIAGACAFPDVTFQSDGGTSGGTGSTIGAPGASTASTPASLSHAPSDTSSGATGSGMPSGIPKGSTAGGDSTGGNGSGMTSHGNGSSHGSGTGNGSTSANGSTSISASAGTSTSSTSVAASSTSSRMTTTSTSTAVTSTASSSSVDCDVDKDGFSSNQPACGGNDCNDHDARVNVAVTSWIQDVPTPQAGWLTGDWNCDGTVDLEFPTGNVMCDQIKVSSLLNPGACASISGYMGAVPGCGASAPFVTCAAPPLVGTACILGSTTSQAQGCR